MAAAMTGSRAGINDLDWLPEAEVVTQEEAAHMSRFSNDDEQVVVVIGSGAGGGTVADVLCSSGIDVVMLEAGKRIDPHDFIQDENGAYEQLAWKEPRVASGTWQVAKDHPEHPAWQCQVVGGTTVHWTGMALRFQAHEFRARTEYGAMANCDLIDWPFGLDELRPYYERAERRMGVSGDKWTSRPSNQQSL